MTPTPENIWPSRHSHTAVTTLRPMLCLFPHPGCPVSGGFTRLSLRRAAASSTPFTSYLLPYQTMPKLRNDLSICLQGEVEPSRCLLPNLCLLILRTPPSSFLHAPRMHPCEGINLHLYWKNPCLNIGIKYSMARDTNAL